MPLPGIGWNQELHALLPAVILSLFSGVYDVTDAGFWLHRRHVILSGVHDVTRANPPVGAVFGLCVRAETILRRHVYNAKVLVTRGIFRST